MNLPDIVILAGGKGTRLRSVVSDLPKPMAPVAGKPFLHYLLHFLESRNARNIVLATGYMHQTIEAYFGNSFGKLNITYSQETEPLGTGGAIKKALSLCSSENVLVYNGDTLFLGIPSELVDFHKDTSSDISLFLKPMNLPERYGTVVLDEGLVTSFKEKNPDILHGLINTGVYCMRSDCMKEITDSVFSFEQQILEPFSRDGRISGKISDAFFIDIGIPEDYEKANQSFGNLAY